MSRSGQDGKQVSPGLGGRGACVRGLGGREACLRGLGGRVAGVMGVGQESNVCYGDGWDDSRYRGGCIQG